MVEEKLMTTKEVAKLLGVTHRAVEQWRSEGMGPKFFRLSPHCIRYRREDVDRWLEYHLVSPGQTPAGPALL